MNNNLMKVQSDMLANKVGNPRFKNEIRLMGIAGLLLIAFLIQAQSHYPGQHAGKFTLEDRLTPVVYSFDLQDVRLLDGRFKQNQERMQRWILSIGVNRLLHSFRTNAGLYSGNEGGYDERIKLAGWESLDSELRGHTAGHVLSALALLYASTGDEQFKIKSDSLLKGLADVQRALNQDGFLSAWPQELINRNIAGKKVWAPWYTQHKILSGLIDQYLYCDNRLALDIATGMASWAYKKLQPVTPQQRIIMLRNEFGGINESFYNLYAITGKAEYKWLAAFFYHNETLDPLKEGKDILESRHANTYIPKLLGLTREYELENTGAGDSMAIFFWNTVIEHHSFCTGSNSDKEHFFKPDHQAEHLSGFSGESCNVYNMLKLTRHLFTHTANIKYADYYEQALFNHILGQQDPATGMVAYFLPMLPGAHKVYSTPDSSFWCCVGSGFENQAKFGEAIYYHSDDAIYINLFIASELNWKEKGIRLRQETTFPEEHSMQFTIEAAGQSPFDLHLRYPSWAKDGVTLTVNGRKIKVKQQPGSYITLNRKWKAGDKIELKLPMALHAAFTNNDSAKAAIIYGPIVLAGEMGTAGFTGRGPYSNPLLHNDYYTYNYNVPVNTITGLSLDLKKINEAVKPISGQPLGFNVIKERVTLRPLYDIHRQRYVVYWQIIK